MVQLSVPLIPELWIGTYAFVFLAAYVVCVVIRRRYFSAISDIPGPFLASFSVLWEVWEVVAGHIEVTVIALHKKHGHFVRISHEEVSVSHPDAIRAILLTPLTKIDWYKVMALPDHRFQTPMSEVNPKRRVERAKNVAAGYTLSSIIKSEPQINDAIELLEKRLDELSKAGQPVEFDRWFNYLAFDVIGEVTFSRAFGFLETSTDIDGSIANSRVLTLYVALAGFFLTLHNATLGNPWMGKLGLTPSQHIFDTVSRAVASRKKNTEARTDMMEHWMQAQAAHPERFGETEIQAVASATVGAGADTVSATLQAFWYYLLRKPEDLTRLQTEIDKASREGKLSKVVSYAEARELPFLQACIKETFRFHPAVAHGLARVVPEEGIKIGDRVFSQGTHLSVNPWVIHRSTEMFGADANMFNPQRWLEPRAKDMEKYMVQFGAGYNSCPGQNLARMEISKVTATLVRDFDIRQPRASDIPSAKQFSSKKHRMVALDLVHASNAQLRELGPGLVALFVGATSGIGEYTAKAFVKNALSPRVYIVGRSESAAERIIKECKELNKDGKVEFLKADVSELGEVDRVCAEIAKKESHINLIVQTQGNMNLRGRDGKHTRPPMDFLHLLLAESHEGIDRKFALNYYSRMRFISNLLPLLQTAASKPPHFSRTLSVLSAGWEGKLDFQDLELKNTFSRSKCATQSTTMNSIMTEEFSKRQPATTFSHSYPSGVNTGLARELPVWARAAAKVLTPLMAAITVSQEETGARQLFIATSGLYPPAKPFKDDTLASGVPAPKGFNSPFVGANGAAGSGAYLANWNCEAATGKQKLLKQYREENVGAKIWDHTMGIFDRAAKINQARQ
ncbi:hypothetical protein V495_08597 [Pseudogymnoascus sp. VKM F-4514 (FW-929)]|nr:hypothetical protein V495_08597 [Pseudogymnoascus sp. VKM F-4514 (FW-929)]KFY51156.1 hypothetical protein V497_09346 [Pseudogymnoascus sp. VKM F-4516 (FW-969)]